MLKDLEKGNWIIPPWDPRYGKLGHIWKKYPFNKLFKEGEGVKPKNKIYFIPELVIENYITNKVYLTKEYGDWISRNKESILTYSMHLTEEEYYLLTVLHINRKLDIPRCPNCKCQLTYTYRFNVGYWIFCSRSCNASFNLRYQFAHLDQYPTRLQHTIAWSLAGRAASDFGELWKTEEFRNKMINSLRSRIWDPKFRTYCDMRRFILSGDENDEAFLYVTENEKYFKFGATKDPELRSRLMPLDGGPSDRVRCIIKSTRLEIAYIEATIKLHFKGREWLDVSESHEFFKYCRLVLTDRPVPNPFD